MACVAAYWALIWVWGVTWHHWIILIAAPMVLLRSPQSIALGVKWFDEYLDWESKKPIFIKMISAAVTSFIVSAVAVFIFAEKLKFTSNNLIIFLITTLAVLAAINTVVAVAVSILSGYVIDKLPLFLESILIPGALIGVLLRAFFVRIWATIFYIWNGLKSLPRNWRFACISNDIFHPPELVPEHERTTLGGNISFSSRFDNGSEKNWFLELLNLLQFLYFTPPPSSGAGPSNPPLGFTFR
jgi:hypothetical protein